MLRRTVLPRPASSIAAAEPDLRLTMDGVDFLLLATGNAAGATLFVDGRVEVEGDPWLAMRLPRVFAV